MALTVDTVLGGDGTKHPDLSRIPNKQMRIPAYAIKIKWGAESIMQMPKIKRHLFWFPTHICAKCKNNMAIW